MVAAAPGAEGEETRAEKKVVEEESSRRRHPSASQAVPPPLPHPEAGALVRMKGIVLSYFTEVPLTPGDGAAVEEQEEPGARTPPPTKPSPGAPQQDPPQPPPGAPHPHPWGPPLYREPPALGYPTCPLEIEIRRRQFEERALRVPKVEGDPLEDDPLEIKRLRRQFEEIALLIPETTQGVLLPEQA